MLNFMLDLNDILLIIINHRVKHLKNIVKVYLVFSPLLLIWS